MRGTLIGARVAAFAVSVGIVAFGVKGCASYLSGRPDGKNVDTVVKSSNAPKTQPPAPPDTPAPTAPKSFAQGVQGVVDTARGAANGAAQTMQERIKQAGIADDPNILIWYYIATGNYNDDGKGLSDKGFTSFEKCLPGLLNVKMIEGKVYDYDPARVMAKERAARYPEVTETLTTPGSKGEGETLLAAVINSDPKVNDYRLEMVQELIRAGADPNQPFGPDMSNALMLAADKGDVAIVKFLRKRCDVNKKDLAGATAADGNHSDSIKDLLR